MFLVSVNKSAVINRLQIYQRNIKEIGLSISTDLSKKYLKKKFNFRVECVGLLEGNLFSTIIGGKKSFVFITFWKISNKVGQDTESEISYIICHYLLIILLANIDTSRSEVMAKWMRSLVKKSKLFKVLRNCSSGNYFARHFKHPKVMQVFSIHRQIDIIKQSLK